MVAITLLEHLLRQQILRRGRRKRSLQDALAVVDANIAILRMERKNLMRDLKKKKKTV
jgi:hypothetical protein